MARLPRGVVAGQAHLVLLRALDHQPVATDDLDRQRLLAALREAALQQKVAIHAYALLSDRLRLLATPDAPDGLSRLVQDLGRRYVGLFNRRHGRRGTLWDGRFRASLVQSGLARLQAALFVDGEPVRAGRVDDAAAHRESSAGHHLGRVRDLLVAPLAEHWQLGNTPFERDSAYAQRLAEGLSAADLLRFEQANQKGWAVGDAGFVAEMEAQASRPLAPRRRGRPPRAGA